VPTLQGGDAPGCECLPHCRRESEAWEFEDGRWLTHDPAGARVWFDETQQIWRRLEPKPHKVELIPQGKDFMHVCRTCDFATRDATEAMEHGRGAP
jgi:hypothetical protein